MVKIYLFYVPYYLAYSGMPSFNHSVEINLQILIYKNWLNPA